MVPVGTLYDCLGVERDADQKALRAAYRRLARRLHPDVAGDGADGSHMARVNEAWRILSDPSRRRAYDATLPQPAPTPRPAFRAPGPAGDDAGPSGRPPDAAPRSGSWRASPPGSRAASPAGSWGAGVAGSWAAAPAGSWAAAAGTGDASPGARREAWLASLRLQIMRLGAQAARSACQTLAVRHRGVPRDRYEQLVEPVVRSLLADTAERVRAARVAGAAPLDLAIGAALLGLRAYGDKLPAEARAAPTRLAELAAVAEMVDRMWDTMAHEIPRELEVALGGNPRASRRLR